ncbi:unnamed protein product [Taenia asiatica]|uniref:HECT-type E3 ubiquitin transferase n=1 Tax=Taenia asiatica TaxID=60517 RepID=A0A0R3VYB2_TAEAS|nr:unnamed protein product [Taenia asiatica]
MLRKGRAEGRYEVSPQPPRLMVEWRLNRGVGEQTEAFLKGLFEVVDPSWLQVFDERELEVSLPILQNAFAWFSSPRFP